MPVRDLFKSLRHLLLFMKPRIFGCTLAFAGNCIANAGFGIVVAFIFKDMFDAAVKGQTSLLIRAVISVCMATAVLSVVSMVSGYVYNRCVKQTIAEIRIKVLDHAMKLPMSYCESHHSGDVMSRLTNDIQTLEGVYSSNMVGIVTMLLNGIGCTVSLFILEWRITLMVILLGLLSSFINIRFVKPLRVIGNAVQKQYGTLVSSITDMMSGIHMIRMFDIGKTTVEKFDKKNDDFTGLLVKNARMTSLLAVTNAFLGKLNFIAIVIVGIFLILRDLLNFGSIVAMVELAGGINVMLLSIGSYVSQLQTSLAGADRVFEILKEPLEPDKLQNADEKPDDASSGKVTNEVITMRNVDYCYDENKKIIHNMSISICKGQIAALVGASGSGKSTLLKLLMGLYPCRSGDIKINGRPIQDYSLDELRDFISYVPQDICLFSVSIEDNIRFGHPGATQEEVIAAAKMANAHDFIMELQDGYETLIEENSVNLSGGQKQRIAIARALLKNAPVLLMDEATSALDTGSERLVQDALDTLMQGRTVLAVSHKLSFIRNADIIYTLKDGFVAESGCHDELMALQGIYSRYYDLQANTDSIGA